MGLCKCGISLVYHVLSFFQVALAVVIAAVVAVKLTNVEVTADTSGVNTTYTCLLGQDYKSSSLCTYTFVVVGVSLAVSLAVSLVQCFTCNLCGLGGILDVLLAVFGSVWWGVASGVIASNANESLSSMVDMVVSGDVDTAREAVPIMCYVETGLFIILAVVSTLRCCCFR